MQEVSTDGQVFCKHSMAVLLMPCCCLSPVFQDRLSQQQSQLQEVIATMEARLDEQTRLLKQVSPCCVLCLGQPSWQGMGGA